MIILENSELRAAVLHPVDDRSRLGPRYCAGGYVYQVEDKKRGPLFSGPEYPSPSPSVINGQGMPDVFQFTLYDDPDETPEAKLVIGVGLLGNAVGQKASDSHFTLPVSDHCTWDMEIAADDITMFTHQAHDGRSLDLRRSLTLRDRTLVSRTEITNTGARDMMFRWFAHPFFPRMAEEESCMPGFPFVLPACGGFSADSAGTIRFNRSFDWNTGCFQLLEGVEGQQFSARQRHPVCGHIEVAGDFPLHRVALWANQNTFSIEPFLQRTLQPGEGYTWTLSYRF